MLIALAALLPGERSGADDQPDRAGRSPVGRRPAALRRRRPRVHRAEGDQRGRLLRRVRGGLGSPLRRRRQRREEPVPLLPLRRAKHCSRFKTRHTLRRAKGLTGLNRVAYSGRVGKTKLRPGTYRAALTATDAAGNRSRARTVSFRVVKR
jgi:hypothetical protein